MIAARHVVTAIASVAVLAAAALVPAQAQEEGATVIELTGDQQVPPVTTEARGEAEVSYDQETNTLEWTLTYEGVTATGAHFHGPAEPGENADVRVPIEGEGGLTSPATGSAEITDEEEAELLA